MIFNLEAKEPIDLILGYMGNLHEVIPLMQTISHNTRAYISNSNGLAESVLKSESTHFSWNYLLQPPGCERDLK